MKIIGQTKSLRNSQSGRKAFVFANGPSVKKLDPYKVLSYKKEGYDIFAINAYVNTHFGEIVKPDYYVLSDPAYFGCGSRLISQELKNRVQNDMAKVKQYGATLFIPLNYYNNVTYEKKFAFNDAEDFFSNNVVDITRTRGYSTFTVYKALAIACYLGYDPIYICGVDNDYFKTVIVDKDNIMYYVDKHFDSTIDAPKRKHKVLENSGKSMGELLYNYHFHFKTLEKFVSFPIVNLDDEGLIDCFSKYHNLDVYTESRNDQDN